MEKRKTKQAVKIMMLIDPESHTREERKKKYS